MLLAKILLPGINLQLVTVLHSIPDKWLIEFKQTLAQIMVRQLLYILLQYMFVHPDLCIFYFRVGLELLFNTSSKDYVNSTLSVGLKLFLEHKSNAIFYDT